jgi:hypothetical protein
LSATSTQHQPTLYSNHYLCAQAVQEASANGFEPLIFPSPITGFQGELQHGNLAGRSSPSATREEGSRGCPSVTVREYLPQVPGGKEEAER